MDGADGTGLPAPGDLGTVVVARILARRSTRDGYVDRGIQQDLLETVVRCGLSAPSSKNSQPWRLHVVTDRRILDDIADAAAGSEGLDEYVPHDPRTGTPHRAWRSTVLESSQVLRDVPAAIVIENRGVFSRSRAELASAGPARISTSLFSYSLESMGLGAALENMWLAAEALGLSAAFLGDLVIAEAFIQRRLAVDGDVAGVLALGYAEPLTPPPPRDHDPHDPERVMWIGPGTG